MRKYTKSKLVHGVGINDVDYEINTYESWYDDFGRYHRKVVWRCPYYVRWISMLERCYSIPYLRKRPSYSDCVVCPEWYFFSKFKAWMETQDWEGKHLDKDLIFRGNKIYSPSTCFFVPPVVNTFLNEKTKSRGDYLIGASLRRKNGKFTSQCSDPRTNIEVHLGDFCSQEEAHLAWLSKKEEFAIILAETVDNPVVARLLIERYRISNFVHGEIL